MIPEGCFFFFCLYEQQKSINPLWETYFSAFTRELMGLDRHSTLLSNMGFKPANLRPQNATTYYSVVRMQLYYHAILSVEGSISWSAKLWWLCLSRNGLRMPTGQFHIDENRLNSLNSNKSPSKMHNNYSDVWNIKFSSRLRQSKQILQRSLISFLWQARVSGELRRRLS